MQADRKLYISAFFTVIPEFNRIAKSPAQTKITKLYKVILDFDWVAESPTGIKKTRDGFETLMPPKNCSIAPKT